MTSDGEKPRGGLDDVGPGERLRRAREGKRMDIQAVAQETRISVRHLEALEEEDFSALPGSTYAVGFGRAYARTVDLDEQSIAEAIRAELEHAGLRQQTRPPADAPADQAQVPPRRLAWTAAAIALILAFGYGIWRTQVHTPRTDQEMAAEAARQTAAPTAPARPAATRPAAGPVVLTATDAVWLRIYDADGNRILEREMAKGERFTLPAAANNPMILTGRPDALAVTVGGRPVPPLGPPDKTVADLPISASALLARAGPAPDTRPVPPASQPQANTAPPPPAAAPGADSAPQGRTPESDGPAATPSRPARPALPPISVLPPIPANPSAAGERDMTTAE